MNNQIINVVFGQKKQLQITFETKQAICVEIASIHQGSILPVYKGSYEVTPMTVQQLLSTKEKHMLDDVTIHEIPYFETTNEYGETVSIAS